MPFFDEIGKKITSISQDTVKKTKEFSETTKINGQISNEEDKIKNIYSEIGKLYYDEFSDEPHGKFVGYCMAIKESFNKIVALKSQILIIKGVKTCKNCGAEMPQQSIFCGNCGTKNEDPTPEVTESGNEKRCSSCSAIVAEGIRFCSKCGSKIGEE